VFAQFLDERKNIAVLVDQFGGMAGIITMEDLVESLLGSEIVDESDVEIDMQKLARRRWERRARQMGVSDAIAPAPPANPPGDGD
jgi:CBS domain containing-hemolysin-like protein